ncbi:hypothetical protein [Henriciella litoralis]|uniref:hypothetical protein n=1 Tax=Henriciella litoralis TaxID=568102 RepID=UPI000A04A17E|nr:hypothetical protein [Henriciella litoralis]
MFERKLAAGFLLALGVQTSSALLWAGAAAQRIQTLEQRVELSRPVAERLARVETHLEAIETQLDRIETRLGQRDE